MDLLLKTSVDKYIYTNRWQKLVRLCPAGNASNLPLLLSHETTSKINEKKDIPQNSEIS